MEYLWDIAVVYIGGSEDACQGVDACKGSEDRKFSNIWDIIVVYGSS